MADIDMKVGNQKFNFRVAGLIKNGDKVLIQKIANNPFYCLPGGHVELGEDTAAALKREIMEEIGKELKDEKLFAVIENFFDGENGKQYHEIGFYYKAELNEEMETKDYSIVEIDKGEEKKLEYKWVTKESLRDVDFRPIVLKDLLFDESGKVEHIILKPNK